jgi:high-affinity nickel-transport protein
MDALPADWTSLAIVVFLLGMKHGFDADHLATIDGLTRVSRRAGSPWSRWCGALFSVGHGAVVIAIAALVGSASERWDTPAWLQTSGAWISIFFLTLLGTLNLRAVWTASPDEVVAPVGLKGRFLGRLAHARSPWVVMMVGAAFALSFDTVSQAALFAATAVQFGGLRDALALGALFLLGMLVTDGVNGLWISRLIARADSLACVASRVMGLAVGSVSLLVAGLGATRLLAPAFSEWTEGRELAFGAAVVAIVVASFAVGRWLAHRSAPEGALDSAAR